MMIELELVGVRVELPSSQPLVLLKEKHGDRHLPIWIGAAEASAIAIAAQGVQPPRPLTHDLMHSLVGALGHALSYVVVTSVEDAVFYAQLVFDDGTTVGARPSDALALAQRAECQIWCADDVMEEAGVVISVVGEEGETETTGDEEAQLRQFRRFLDQVDPEDFES